MKTISVPATSRFIANDLSQFDIVFDPFDLISCPYRATHCVTVRSLFAAIRIHLMVKEAHVKIYFHVPSVNGMINSMPLNVTLKDKEAFLQWIFSSFVSCLSVYVKFPKLARIAALLPFAGRLLGRLFSVSCTIDADHLTFQFDDSIIDVLDHDLFEVFVGFNAAPSELSSPVATAPTYIKPLLGLISSSSESSST